MKTVVALGAPAARVASAFEEYSQYTVYKISKLAQDGARSLHLPPATSAEEYDANGVDMSALFKELPKEIIFVVCGGTLESAASLRLLQAMREAYITVVYIIPDRKFLNEEERLNERTVFHVLQEYARSGAFERIYLIDNVAVENALKADLTVKNYYKKINETIANTLHMLNVFQNSDAEFDEFSPLRDISRISTIGVATFENAEKSFYTLNNVEEKDYYFAISEEGMQREGLLQEIKKYITAHEEDMKINYSIFTTAYEDHYVYFVSHTSKIQTIP